MPVNLSMVSRWEAFHIIAPVVTEVMETIVIPKARVIDPTDAGGWFFFCRDDPNQVLVPLFGLSVGDPPAANFPRYTTNAGRKWKSLADNPASLSSWEVRDESAGIFGGAIRVIGGVFFISGLPEHFDEMGMILCAERLRLINPESVGRIIQISDNQPYRDYVHS